MSDYHCMNIEDHRDVGETVLLRLSIFRLGLWGGLQSPQFSTLAGEESGRNMRGTSLITRRHEAAQP